jgi:hypothetical protein
VSGPRFPIGLRGATTAYVASANTDAAKRGVRPGRHVPTVRDPSASAADESSHGSASELHDVVLRLRQDNRGCHKLSPPWEGPYIVVKVLKPGTYKLANEDGEELTNAWNIQQLRRFYP